MTHNKAITWLDHADILQFTIGGGVRLNPNYVVQLMLSKYKLSVIYLPFIYNNRPVELYEHSKIGC